MAKKWRCTVCGYIHEGPEAPDQCPMCKVGKEKFVEVVEQEEGLTFVTEHVIGDGKGASKELWEGLQNHFMGECTEVGMYLAMSRQADREGYPEIAEAYKRYAWEEAEHASKFAELIGEVVWDTKTNLMKRMNAESGACEDKMRLARMAKEENLDAVHDTVHEMAKDEARRRRLPGPLQPLLQEIGDDPRSRTAVFRLRPREHSFPRLFVAGGIHRGGFALRGRFPVAGFSAFRRGKIGRNVGSSDFLSIFVQTFAQGL